MDSGTDTTSSKKKKHDTGLTKPQLRELKQSLYSEKLFNDMQVIDDRTSGKSSGSTKSDSVKGGS